MNKLFFLSALVLTVCFTPLPLMASDSPIKVKIIVDEAYPPYSYAVNGAPRGIYIEMIRKAGTLLNDEYHIEFESMPWKRALKEIELGHAFAILPPYIHRQARPYIGPYSVSLLTERVVAVCNKHISLKSLFQDANAQQSKPLNIGINAGYLMFTDKYKELIAQEKIKVWENKSTQANLHKLIDGKIDCYVNDSRAIEYNLAMITDVMPGEFVEADELSRQTAHIGFSNSSKGNFPYKSDFIYKLNQAISIVKEQHEKFKD
ncbi:substrate-binding periplasmic protein [Pseudoalteromonas sp. SS15]|uniref:substrate-binding periplasmic protein n=1 Tax=Pseudoalteromonas sp. SS15 TaxID=3139393 RepID=UPI003BAD87BA